MTGIGSVQHLNLKIFLEEQTRINLDDAIGVFHRWIRDRVRPEMLIDVADYRHVHAGPGIVLIGHEANYSLDNRDGRLGLLYNRKAPLPGSLQERLHQAHQSVLQASELFASEPCFGGRLRFDPAVMDLSINDRLLAPNSESTWLALQPELEQQFPDYGMRRCGEPRDLFRVRLEKLARS